MASLTDILSDAVSSAFEAAGLPRELGRVSVSDRPDLAQFQCNGAMSAARIAKRAPRQVAEDIVARLQGDVRFAKMEIAGPGFLNFDVSDALLATHLRDAAAGERLGVPQLASGTAVLDYGGPNIAKPMHVGHLRASIIGDCLRRVCAFAGYKSVGDVHMGDWGTPMGMILSELELRHPDWVYFDAGFTGPYPEKSPVSMESLEDIYPSAAAACKSDEARMEKARAATLELQTGRAGYRALWKHFISVSISGMKRNFDALGVHFDLWQGEADAHPYIAPMIEDLTARGIAVESDGAVVVPVAKEGDAKEVPPLILLKRDGAVMYGTTDLATILERMKTQGPNRIIYVVDQRQSLHFEQVFRAARLSGIAPEGVDLVHAGFGTMNGPDGKPFKTRAGGVLKLEDLIAMGIAKARQRLDEAKLGEDMAPEEKEEIAHKVAIAAIKFADLQNNRESDYIFDLDRLTAFEGKTGPYLLYQAVRIASLLAKAAAKGDRPGTELILTDIDRPLALVLAGLPDAVAGAVRSQAPHHLCDFAYRLAQAFSSFYNSCHILSEEDAALKASRLALCDITCRELVLVLGLLGISVPARM
jgi:arginyl-tRNA synthetase